MFSVSVRTLSKYGVVCCMQILMNDLDPDFMALFSTVAFTSAHDLMEYIGLTKLMPGAIIDAKIFEPCGFSLNAIAKVT